MSDERDIGRLRRFREQILSRDKDLRDRVIEEERMIKPESTGRDELELESIIFKRTRPVLAVKKGHPEIVFEDRADLPIWEERLKAASGALAPGIASVGRVELANASFSWVGTGWLVDADVLVTNRHVAAEFVARESLTFVAGPSGTTIEPSVDFLREVDSEERRSFAIVEPLYVAGPRDPDIALLRVAPQNDAAMTLASKIEMRAPRTGTRNVAVVGYPARDSRIPDYDLMRRIYGDVYDRKRVAPGDVVAVKDGVIEHNCTTLGGNSGSVLMCLDSGEALGLHFGGAFLRANYAVSSEVIDGCLRAARRGQRQPRRDADRAPRAASVGGRGGDGPIHVDVPPDGEISITIPLHLRLSLGDAARGASSPPALRGVRGGGALEGERFEEGRATVESYEDREGYVTTFLGRQNRVPLPIIGDQGAIQEVDGDDEGVLRYEHFSVVMNRHRRMCFFSAVNIDGELSRKSRRGGWRFDPRLPESLQIRYECYGNSPKFSRGHMTRREDPAWGNKASVERGSDDSMHVTNAVPQMQSFNSPIWLGLEDYALGSAREDDMKISVFTGPYFDDGDPEYWGVQIPTSFWKVVVFIHDETGELCATGYEMSQADNLPPVGIDLERIFDDYVVPGTNLSTQVPISRIQAKSGLNFGRLVELDPLSREEGFEALTPPLERFEQIRFF